MNPIVRFFNAIADMIGDIGRALGRKRSTADLLDETAEGIRDSFGDQYENAKSAAGQLQVTDDMLAKAQSTARTARANADRAAKASEKMTGDKLKQEQINIVRLKQMAIRAETVVNGMTVRIERAKLLQQRTEGNISEQALKNQLKELEIRSDYAEEQMARALESIYDSQLRANGNLPSDRKYKDHSAEIRQRSQKAMGRADSAGRIVEQVLGSKELATELTAEEEEILSQAYADAGAKRPEAEAASEKSAS